MPRMNKPKLSTVFIDEKENVYLDGKKIENLFSYKIENSADSKEPAKLTTTVYVTLGEIGSELQK